MYQRLLVTNDGSALADAALAHAAALAQPGAGILVLRVSHAEGVSPAELTAEAWDEYVRDITADAPLASDDDRVEAFPPLSNAVEALHAAGVRAVGKLLIHGEPGPAIVEVAGLLDCDLIVMSTHGLSGVRRAVLGSVADYVVRHAQGIPVLLCRPRE